MQGPKVPKGRRSSDPLLKLAYVLVVSGMLTGGIVTLLLDENPPTGAVPQYRQPTQYGGILVVGTDWMLQYTNGSSDGAFGNQLSHSCRNCPVAGTVGVPVGLIFELNDSDRVAAHTIESISLVGGSPFTILSTSPTLPRPVGPLSGALITVTIVCSGPFPFGTTANLTVSAIVSLA